MVAILATGAAVAADPATYVPAEPQEARVESFASPKYPAEALARRQEGTVEVRGMVDPRSGRLRNVEYRPVEPDSAIFVESLASVVPRWRFRPPTKDCVPTDEVAVTPVAFLVNGKTPSVTPVPEPKVSSGNPPIYKPVKRVNPRWPTEMLRRNWTGTVYARLEIDNDGKVADLRTRVYSPDTADDELLEPFTRLAASALRKWEFIAVPPDFAGPRVACYDIRFHLTDSN